MADVHYGPRSRANARALLEAAEGLGLPGEVVRTQTGGYLVPEEVVAVVQGVDHIEEGKEYEAPANPDPISPEPEPVSPEPVAPEPEAKESQAQEEVKRPSQADSKAEWLAYALNKNLAVTEDNTKAEIVDAVKATEKESD